MAKPKHEQMDFKGLELVADEFTGTFNGPVTGVTATSVPATPISPGTATDVQGILAELAARILDLENP